MSSENLIVDLLSRGKVSLSRISCLSKACLKDDCRQRLQKLVRSEIGFLESMLYGRLERTPSRLNSTNLTHLEALIGVLESPLLSGTSAIMHTLTLPLKPPCQLPNHQSPATLSKPRHPPEVLGLMPVEAMPGGAPSGGQPAPRSACSGESAQTAVSRPGQGFGICRGACDAAPIDASRSSVELSDLGEPHSHVNCQALVCSSRPHQRYKPCNCSGYAPGGPSQPIRSVHVDAVCMFAGSQKPACRVKAGDPPEGAEEKEAEEELAIPIPIASMHPHHHPGGPLACSQEGGSMVLVDEEHALRVATCVHLGTPFTSATTTATATSSSGGSGRLMLVPT
eukprot:jgi/Mesen1/217/ME1140679C07638